MILDVGSGQVRQRKRRYSDIGLLDAPVPTILEHEWMLEEELRGFRGIVRHDNGGIAHSRIKSTHVAVPSNTQLRPVRIRQTYETLSG